MSDDFNKIAYFKCLRGVKIDRGALHVLVALYTYADADGGNARPGAKRLAEDCLMGESTVRNHLKLLADLGFIRQERRGGRSGDKQVWASTYRLCIPESSSVSTSQDSEVEIRSTSENSAVEAKSQPLSFESQPLSSQRSTSEFSEGTKSLPTQLPPSQWGGDSETASNPALGDITPPPLYCRIHDPDGPDGPCGPCGDRRRANDRWLTTPKGLEYLKRQTTVQGAAKQLGKGDIRDAAVAVKTGRTIEQQRAGVAELLARADARHNGNAWPEDHTRAIEAPDPDAERVFGVLQRREVRIGPLRWQDIQRAVQGKDRPILTASWDGWLASGRVVGLGGDPAKFTTMGGRP